MTDLRLKCIKFDFGWAPLGELTALPRPPSWIWEPPRGRGRGWAGEDEGKMEVKEREGKWRGRKGSAPSYCRTTAPQRLATTLTMGVATAPAQQG